MLARPLLDRRQCSFAIVTTNPMIFLHFERLMGNSETGAPLHPALPYTGAEAVWAARKEMARTVEDVLARRTRALFLNARAAIAMAPRVPIYWPGNWDATTNGNAPKWKLSTRPAEITCSRRREAAVLEHEGWQQRWVQVFQGAPKPIYWRQ